MKGRLDMKKKILLILSCALVLMLAFAVTAFAESVHEGKVDLSATVTLDNGTVVPLFDAEGEALIWYLDGGELKSIRTDDQRVKWYTERWDEVTSVGIHIDEGKTISSGNFVVVNMMDDDVVKNHGNVNGEAVQHYGKPVSNFKFLFQGCKNLEYVYLRLDTTSIMKQSFNGCSKLKFINLEDLTKVQRIGDNNNFAGCTSLFKGQVVDLTKLTKLWAIDWCDSFKNVPMAGIKLPSSITRLSGATFIGRGLVSTYFPINMTAMDGKMYKDCTSLTTIGLNGKLTTIADYAFENCTSLTTVYFVGSLEQLNTLLAGVSKTGNDPFWAVVGENNANVISYSDYQKLADKSGKYVIYDYSQCEVFNDGIHSENREWYNPCVSFCETCSCNVINHADGEAVSVKIEYVDFSKAGNKVSFCTNEGCTHSVYEEVGAIFVCLGYSAQENGDSIALGYLINRDEYNAYTSIMNNEFSYGVFAGLKNTVGNNEILDEDGKAIAGTIAPKISSNPFDVFVLKVSGITGEQKNAMLALGAYVSYKENGTLKHSYMQAGAPLENNKYCFTSFNEIIASAK